VEKAAVALGKPLVEVVVAVVVVVELAMLFVELVVAHCWLVDSICSVQV